jgi:hypothetical protein
MSYEKKEKNFIKVPNPQGVMEFPEGSCCKKENVKNLESPLKRAIIRLETRDRETGRQEGM